MTAPELLEHFGKTGIHLQLIGTGGLEAHGRELTDTERRLIREQMPHLVRELRRNEVLAQIETNTTIRYAWRTYAEREYVVLVGAIRAADASVATFEMSIPVERYDATRLARVLGLVPEAAA